MRAMPLNRRLARMAMLGVVVMGTGVTWGDTITVTSGANAGAGSLREAIDTINSTSSSDGMWEVVFSVSAVSLTSALPDISAKNSATVSIVGNSAVTISGDSGAPDLPVAFNAFTVNSPGVGISGVAITGFSTGIVIAAGASGSVIKNSNLLENAAAAIEIHGDGARVLGNTIGNPVTNATFNGIGVLVSANDATISGNTISDVGAGIWLNSAGGKTGIHANVISASSGNGVLIQDSSGALIDQNTIGNNDGNDVEIKGTSQGNVVIGNELTGKLFGGNGVALRDPSALNPVRANRISGHVSELGINVGEQGDGITYNADDPDHEHFPVINEITFAGGNYVVKGTIDGPGGVYDIDFFASTLPNTSQGVTERYGEGQTYLGTLGSDIGSSYINLVGSSVTGPTFTAIIPGGLVPAGQTWFTATATSDHGLGRTSEFSLAYHFDGASGGGVDPYAVPLPHAVWAGLGLMSLLAARGVLRNRAHRA